MASDDQRRAVAARMREIMRRDPHGFLDIMVARSVLDVMGEGMRIGETLADLIDPPTCAMVREGEGFRCSACGEYHDMSGFDEFPWAFCPECGARVAEGGAE